LPLRVLFNPINQGYGGNQKIGYHYAIKERFDFVALVHGDGQYAPEALPELLKPLSQAWPMRCLARGCSAEGAALKGGRPLYKFVGNKILTWCQKPFLRTHFSGVSFWISGLLGGRPQRIPFDRNTQ